MGEYVLRSAKESSFRTPLHRFKHRLIVSTIHHREKHDKVLSDNHFPMWCLLYINVHLHIPYIIASFFSSNLALGTQPWSKICGGHFICCLAWSYEVDTHRMNYYPFRELDRGDLVRLRAVVHGPDWLFRIPLDDVAESIHQVDL